MKTRASILALAATAALGLSALTPTNASAWGFHGGGFRGGYHFGHFGHWGGFGHYGWRGYGWRYGYGFRHAYWGGYRWWPRWRFYPRPIIYGGGGGAAFAAAGPAPAAAPQAPAPQAPANCLTKSYMPNGTVVFADMCTQEQGIGQPNGGQPGAH